MKRGESCAKTKTEMGLVTAVAGATGLALPPGPPLQPPAGGWACCGEEESGRGIGLGGGRAAAPVAVGLVTAGKQRTCLAPLARPDPGAGVGAGGVPPATGHSLTALSTGLAWHAADSQ